MFILWFDPVSRVDLKKKQRMQFITKVDRTFPRTCLGLSYSFIPCHTDRMLHYIVMR